MSSLAFDLRDALRSLRHSLSYAATVIITLALAIGATTAVFSIVNGVLLKPLAYRESHRLVSLREIWRQFSGRSPVLEVNEQHFEYWRAHTVSFETLAQYILTPMNLIGGAEASQVTIVRASGSLFDVLQVSASIGRTLNSDDERADGPPTVVVTDAFWRQRLGADRSRIGTPITLDGVPYTVVGVLPADFRLPRGEQLTEKIDAFVVIRMSTERVGWVGDHNNDAIGRLKPGVTPDEARAELDVLQRQVGAIATAEAHEPVTLASSVMPLAESVVGGARRGLLLLLSAIGAVLLIACSNLANLGVTRTIGQQRDAAIRSALGASGARLLRKSAIEQMLLSAAGGTIGVAAAWAGLDLFVRTAPVDLPRINEVALDGRALAFAAVLTLLTGMLVALLPAWRTANSETQAALRAGGGGTTGDRAGLRTRSALLALQVALSVALLVVTALLSLSFARLLRVDRGFNAEPVLAVDVALPMNRYGVESMRLAAYDRLLAAIQALPGVEAATTTSMLPLSGQGQVNFVAADGNTRPTSELPTANFRFVAPDYFRALSIAIRRGRSFADAERAPDRPAPALVSEPTAARLWPGQNPIGKRFSRGNQGEQGFQVVGVVADARLTSIERTPPLMVYVPYWWRSRASMSLLIKTQGDPASLMPAVRRAVRAIDPEIAIGQSRPLERLVDGSLTGRRYQTTLFIAFASAALLIAMVGVYGVTAYGVTRRRREMNIRAALGARRAQILGMIVRQTGTPLAVGALAGALGALAIGGLMASLLFEVSPRDPSVVAAVIALVSIAGLGACLLAARRGLQMNPAAVLREE